MAELNPLHSRHSAANSSSPSASSQWRVTDGPTSASTKLLGGQYLCRTGELDESDQLPLHSAAFFGKFSVLSDLINKFNKGCLEERDSNGNTVLHYAIEGGDRSLGCVALLLQNKTVNRDAQNDHGLTPLHVAAMHGLENSMQALLLSGVKREVADAEGNTPMHLAGVNKQFKCVELLIANGASISAKNRRGLTPADVTPVMQEVLCNSKTDCCTVS